MLLSRSEIPEDADDDFVGQTMPVERPVAGVTIAAPLDDQNESRQQYQKFRMARRTKTTKTPRFVTVA
jgi:hypothetical protein